MTDLSAGRPRVTLKLATSLDGRIATRSRQSQWITGPQARAIVHKMRADHDCVLTGIGTVLADDPELTARLDPPAQRQPLRVVLDSRSRMPITARLMMTLGLGPVCVFHNVATPSVVLPNGTHQNGVKMDPRGDGLDLQEIMAVLFTQFQVRSVMVEAGARVAGAFLRAGLVDKLVWFRAPIVIGGDGLSVFASLGIDALPDALAFDCIDIVKIGNDLMETYQIRTAT